MTSRFNLRIPIPAMTALAVAALALASCGAGQMPMKDAAQAAAAPMQPAGPQANDNRVPMLPPKPANAQAPADKKMEARADLGADDAMPGAAPAAEMEMQALDEPIAGDLAVAMEEDGVEWLWEVDDEAWDDGDLGGGWGGGPGGGPAMPQQPQYAAVRQFPVPDYSQPYDGPRTDFRETVYWQPAVHTNGNGEATVSFYLNDAVTSFKATLEGIDRQTMIVGREEKVVSSKLPVSLAVKLPLEVTRGDLIELPVTVSNETDRPQMARVDADIGPAFKVLGITGLGDGGKADSIALGPNQRKSFFYSLQVVGEGFNPEDGNVSIRMDAANLKDEIARTIKVVPEGFPFEMSAAGTLEGESAQHSFTVDNALDGTLVAAVEVYPSPVDSMLGGMESMIRQPGGCFEQASSSNYPNVMILQYMEAFEEVDTDLLERTQGHLDSGYNLLTGYETPEKGYEWFGGAPGHEALTAYGLMEFVQMSEVHDVDQGMVKRTADWLLDRRDGDGGYQRNSRALDSFGRASDDVTNAYITWALTEAGYHEELDEELDHARALAEESKDAYVLALAANTLVNLDPQSEEAQDAIDRLVDMQDEDGGFTNADHSITRSGGVSLKVETTSLAALAMLDSGRDDVQENLSKAAKFIQSQNNGWGGFGATQSTILGLQALTGIAKSSARLPEGTEVVVYVNGKEAGTATYEESGQELVIAGLEEFFKNGKNTVELKMRGDESDAKLPYSIRVSYRSVEPTASDEAAIRLSTNLKSNKVALGETVRMNVEVQNVEKKGQPMALARVGLPGGLTFQTWQLKELREKGVIDFYETREREVILYWRAMAPEDVKRVDLDLMAMVPGKYTATPSTSYLYYTDEFKDWTDPVSVEVTR